MTHGLSEKRVRAIVAEQIAQAFKLRDLEASKRRLSTEVHDERFNGGPPERRIRRLEESVYALKKLSADDKPADNA